MADLRAIALYEVQYMTNESLGDSSNGCLCCATVDKCPHLSSGNGRHALSNPADCLTGIERERGRRLVEKSKSPVPTYGDMVIGQFECHCSILGQT